MQPSTNRDLYRTEETGLLRDDAAVASRSSPLWKRSWILAAVALVLVVCAAVRYHGVRSGPSDNKNMVSLAKTCDNCSFKHCAASLCDPKLAPYMCTKGDSAGGCASSADAWPHYEGCDSCCELTNCKETLAKGEKKGELSKECKGCTEDECSEFGGKQRCGHDAAYVCTEGSSKYGCSADKYHWAAMIDTSCSSCCDMKACE